MLKRCLDCATAFCLVVPSMPLLVLIAVLIKLDTKGPVVFAQRRIGKHGVTFWMYKFRTMVKDAESKGTGLYSYPGDPRVTKVGEWLRKTSLDELPQLFNVLLGSMSIVGPRPPVTYELGNYADFTDEMKVRFRVKPGITGLAQISGRNALEWPDKIVLDNEYVERFEKWGILEDLLIIVKTVWVVLSMRNVVGPARTEET